MAGGVTGAEELQGNIKLLTEALEAKATRDALRAGAEVIQEEMVLNAPLLDEKTAHSTSLEPGAIKRDIRTTMHAADKDGIMAATVGPHETSYVCYWLELGHRLVKGGKSRVLADGRMRGEGHEIGFVEPHPFVRRSYESSIDRALERFGETLKGELQETLK